MSLAGEIAAQAAIESALMPHHPLQAVNRIGFQAVTTYCIANEAFEGLKKCWNNIGYRNGKVACNAIVHTVNIAYSLFNLYANCVQEYNFYNSPYYNYKAPEVKPDADIDPSTLENLSIIKRLNKPELNPENVKHALYMMDPKFTETLLDEKGQSLYKHTYRNLSLKMHPDHICTNKTNPCDEEELKLAPNTFRRLGIAKETLDARVLENKAKNES